MKHKILSVVLLTGACAMAANADSVKASQSIQLTPGWNAVYLTVAPTNTPDALFADWPVDFVAAYDQAAFLETKQYSASNTTEGVQKSGYRIWHRGDPGATSLHGLAANTIYLCFATNAMEKAKTVYGVPRAPRISWHASAADGTRNLVGLSVWQETAISNYFAGVDAGCSEYKQFYGKDAAQPKQGRCSVGEKLGMGNVLVVDATKASDWSGALYVSPMTGIDFGTNATLAALSVRNDGATSRTVRVSLATGAGEKPPDLLQGLKIKDTSTVLASGASWTDFTTSAPFEKKIDAGETLTLSLALDRTNTNFTKKVAGTYCGGLLEITDVDGGSNMRVVVPVEATSDGGASAKTAWPAGVWILSAELNEASYVNAATKGSAGITNVAAGGTMKVRLPMAVDGKGKMTLLQRLWYGYDSNGVMRVIAGSPASDVALYSARRISTAFLPTDQVEIEADGDSTFGKVAEFSFTVGERSNVNPMRHALHPNHDGLDFDFSKPSPSGDVLDNYLGSVKPETFSITNTVQLTWTAGEGGAAWSPEETLTGVLKWAFGGLRHEGTIQAQGPFVMKRISSAKVEMALKPSQSASSSDETGSGGGSSTTEK